MTTLSKTFKTASEHESATRWAAWEARGIAKDARFRKRAGRVLWLLGGIAALVAVIAMAL